MMKTFLILILSISGLACSSVNKSQLKSEEAWRHADFDAEGGTNIALDYIVNVQNTASEILITTKEAWLNVKKSGALESRDRVSAVIITQEIDELGYEYRFNVQEAELNFVENGHFTASLKELYIYHKRNSLNTYRQEVAVSVNDEWLINPINGSTNFKFKLARF